MAATTCTGTYGTSPPSSRLPPDGHEFPGDYLDDSSSSTSSTSCTSSTSTSSHAKLTATPAGAGGRTTAAGLWRSGTQSASANGSGRDERSERSVRDKIALFTNDTKTPAQARPALHANPVKVCKYTPPLSCSVDNLTVGRRSPMISPVARSDARTRLLTLSTASSSASSSASAAAAATAGTSETANLSERSRSLLDVASNNRTHSAGSSARKPSFEVRRKSSLSSKLRGLVIPDERRAELLTSHRPVVDLPEIISKDSVLVVGIAPLTPPLRSPTGSGHSSESHDETDHAKASALGSLPWKSASSSLPKYSPAFKRKELTVARSSSCYQGVHQHQHQQREDEEAPPPPSTKPPPPPLSTATITKTTTALYSSSSDVEALLTRSAAGTGLDEKEANNSDTDGDSAVSSSRSSFSPANSPVPDRRAHHHEQQHLEQQRIDAGRVLKAHSVEALNRKNVLQSARFSSGGSGALDVAPLPLPLPSPPLPAPGKSGDAMRTLQRPAKSGDFEQTLKKFTSAEAHGRIERTAPPRTRLSSSERLEIKTAMITDVCSEPSPVAAIVKAAPQHEASKKSSPSTPTYDYRSSPITSPSKEIKSFRALAERWEAISTSDAASSPPTHCININNNNNNNNSSVVNSNTTTISSSKKTEKPVVKTVSSFTASASSRQVTTRSVTAGVVEIRKAFERVKGELETESSHCAFDGHSEDYAYKQQHQQQHSIFTLQHQSSSSSLGHARMSSLDSTNSDDNSLPFGCGNMFGNYAGYGGGFGGFGGFGGYGGPFGIGVRDNYGSITSLASSTSLISPQELQQLLDEANQSLEESGTPSHEIVVVVLHRGDVASSLTAGLGIALAGGADYETKEITIHKVIGGSVADRDGRIQKGDRVLSINGKGLKGVTHREALAILKAPRPEVVLVLSRNRSVSPQDIGGESDKDLPATMVQASTTGLVSSSTNSSNIGSRTGHYVLSGNSGRPPRILESPSDFGNSYDPAGEAEDVNRGPPIQTTLFKDGAGLGFSLEGGKDSPLGDRPLTIKKIFTGGAASKNGTLRVGDQIISVNACDVTSMSRIEAWNLMKKLADGAVSLVIRQQLPSAS